MPSSSPRSTRRAERPLAHAVALVSILAFGAAVRFAGIGHHLAHDPVDFDEMNNFVEPILEMWRSGSPDPTVYSGYPGFFNWLAFFPVGVGWKIGGQYGAYVGGRALVAAFGVLNVWLIYRLCRAFLGPGAALVGAALMAVSRGEVSAAHKIVPDVLVATGVLAVLLLLTASGPRVWILAGALCGLATAVKYTGLLTVPALAAGLGAGSDRRKSLVAATAVGILAFAAAAPYALKASSGMGMGFDHSLRHYYGDEKAGNLALQGRGLAVGTVASYFVLDLGYPGVLLAAAGLALFRPRRALLPAAAVVASMFLVTAPANKVYPRHVLPATAAAIFLSAVGFGSAVERLRDPWWRRAAGAGVAAALLAPPALAAARSAATYRGPTAADRAVAWVESNLGSPALLASALDPFEPDPTRFEVRGPMPLETVSGGARVQYDLLVARGPAPRDLGDLAVAAEFCEGARPAGCEITLLRPLHRPALLPADTPSEVEASHGGARAAVDSDSATVWTTPPGSAWITLRWAAPQRVARLEFDVDGRETSWPQEVQWDGVVEDGGRRALAAEALRPVRLRRQRAGAPHGQAFVLTPAVRLRELRLARPAGGEWGIAEMRVFTTP